MRIVVVDGDLQGALKRWQKVAIENRSATYFHQYGMAPARRRKAKARRALQRWRKREAIRLYRLSRAD